jgi:hypothetical protein
MVIALPLGWLSHPDVGLVSPARKVVCLNIFLRLHEPLELIIRPPPLAIAPRRADRLLDGADPITPFALVPLELSYLVAWV